jgi:signal transduction histidine kinase
VALSATAEGDFLVLSVTNQGEPISPDNMMQVFKPFWRQSASPAREGLGLGLYICAQIAKAHGGSLEVASTAAAGTTFTARLPLRGYPR